VRVMLVHPGVPWSTGDVAEGYAAGLRALGMDLIDCPLDRYVHFCALGVQAAGAALADANTIALAGAFVAQQALIEWPDLLVAVGATNLHRGTAAALTRAGLKTVAVLLDSPYLLDVEAQLASAYTYVTTNERRAVGALRDAVGHDRVRYLPTAYHPARHTPDGPRLDAPVDVAFIGSLFPERRALFDGADLAGLKTIIGGLELDGAAPQAFENAGLAALYRTARVNLNHHRTTMINGDGRTLPPGAAESMGPRAYEIAACGGFQLMDDARPEAREVFGPALITYRAGDADDLTRQARRWLAMDGARERMATEQHAAIQGHSYTDRARALMEWAL
jgi:hypothetical protein